MERRLVGVEEENGPAIHVERVLRDVEVEGATRGIRVTDIDARDIVGDKCILLDQHVLDHGAPHELVSVDAVPGRGTKLVVVPNQVVPDKPLRSAAVCQADANDVILDGVVDKVRAADTRVQPDAVAREGGINTVLEGEPVDDATEK